MKLLVLWATACLLLAGPACVKRDVVVPLVQEPIVPLIYEPHDGEWGSVRGIVTDSKTGKKLFGASIEAWGSEDGTCMDPYGWFNLRLRPGRYTLIASDVGYAESRSLVLVDPGKCTHDVDFRLRRIVDEDALGPVQVDAESKQKPR